MEAELLADLVNRLPDSAHLIIEAHMQNALILGRWYAKVHKRASDDLVSAAYLGLCQAVAWAPERLHDCNITPYIVSTIHRFCRECIEADHTVVIERRARKEYRERHGDGRVVALTDDHAIESDIARNMIAAELLDTFCPRHRAVIELRLLGMTQVQIAAALNVSQPMVHKYLRDIKETPQLKEFL